MMRKFAWLRRALLTTIVVCLGLLLAVVLLPLFSVENTRALRALVESASVCFFLLRAGFVALVWLFWDAIITWLMTDKQGKQANPKMIEVYQAQRHRVLMLFVIIEVLLVRNLPGTVLEWLS